MTMCAMNVDASAGLLDADILMESGLFTSEEPIPPGSLTLERSLRLFVALEVLCLHDTLRVASPDFSADRLPKAGKRTVMIEMMISLSNLWRTALHEGIITVLSMDEALELQLGAHSGGTSFETWKATIGRLLVESYRAFESDDALARAQFDLATSLATGSPYIPDFSRLEALTRIPPIVIL